MRFNIRDLVWLTMVAALALGWWLDHRTSAARHELLRQLIEQANDAARMEQVQRVQAEKEIAQTRGALEAQARDHEREVKRAMDLLAAPAP